MADELIYRTEDELLKAFELHRLTADEFKKQRDLLEEINKISTDWSKTLSEKIVTAIGGFGDKTKEVQDSLQDTLESSDEIHKSMGNLYKSMVNILNPATSFFELLKLSTKRFFELDDAALNFRTTTGFLASQTSEIESNIRSTSLNFAKFGVTAEDAAASAGLLANAFNDTAIANKENVEYVALMQKNLGVAGEDSVKVMKNFMGIGNTSSNTAKNLAGSYASLAKAAGVPFAKTMKEVAAASDDTLSAVRGSVDALVKGAIEAQRLGTSLDNVGKAAAGLLNFQQSVTDEMDASVLLGRNINLQKARELAYSGDLAGLAKEQARILNETGDLRKMDYFQQQALAKSLGLSVQQMTEMKSKQSELNELRTTNPALYKQYTTELDVLNDQKQSVEEKYKSELLSRQIQSQQQKIANDLKSIFMELSEVLLPLVKLLIGISGIIIRIGSFVIKFLFIPFNFLNNIVDALQEKFTEWSQLPAWKAIIGFVDQISSVFDYLTTSTKDWGQIAVQAIVSIVIAVGLLRSQLSPFHLFMKAGIFSVEYLKSVKGQIGEIGKKLLGIKIPARPTALPTGGLLGSTVPVTGTAGGATGAATGAAGGTAGGTTGSPSMIKKLTDSLKEISPAKILAIGAAMIMFAASLYILAKAGQQFNTVEWESLAKMGASLAVLGGILAVLMATGVLEEAAIGIAILGAALIPFGVAALLAGKGMQMMGTGAKDLMASLEGLSALSLVLLEFATMGFMISLGMLATAKSLSSLNKEIEKINIDKLDALSNLMGFDGVRNESTKNATAPKSTVDDVVKAINLLTDLMKSGGIAVNIDGNRASYLLAKNTRERGGLGATA